MFRAWLCVVHCEENQNKASNVVIENAQRSGMSAYHILNAWAHTSSSSVALFSKMANIIYSRFCGMSRASKYINNKQQTCDVYVSDF